MIDQELLQRVIMQESGGNPRAVSPAGAQGVMQIMPATARQPGYGVTPLQGWDGVNPMTAPVEEQIRFGRDYLNAMKTAHGGDERLALAAYNAGPGAVQAAGNQVPNFKETQDYVNKLAPTSQGVQVAQNTVSDWRSRAQVVTDAVPSTAAPVTGAQGTAPPANDWRSRAKPLEVTPGNWRTRAKPVEAITPGNDLGGDTAFVQGINSAVPFGERMSAMLGAVGAKAYDKTLGDNVTEGQSISSMYDDARASQAKTADNHKGAYITGALTGAAATLPLLSTKVLTGTRATTGVRGAVNAIPEALGAVGNYVRGSQVAEAAGTGAKIANVAGKASRAAIVSAPAGAVYGYSGSRNDLLSKGAVSDAKSGAITSALVGGAVPIVGSALSGIPKPNVSQAVKDLALTAKNKFNIDLSLDQISPTNVRSTVQKISQNIPGSGVESFQAKQEVQWMKGVAKTIGEDAEDLSPDVINRYLERASKDFDTPLAGKTINFDTKDIEAIQAITESASRKVNEGLAKVVKNNVDDVIKNITSSTRAAAPLNTDPATAARFAMGGSKNPAEAGRLAAASEGAGVPGEKLASVRSKLVKDLPNIEGGARQQVAKIIDRLDEVIDRYLSPEEIKQLSTARLQWRNYRTIEPLLEKSTDGMINPTQLMQKVASSKYIKASRKATGEDDLVDIARIGKQFMAKKGGSDTAQKLMYVKGAADLGTAAGLVAAPFKVGPALLANRGYQKLINQSPNVVGNLVGNKASKANSVPIANLLGANATEKLTKKK